MTSFLRPAAVIGMESMPGFTIEMLSSRMRPFLHSMRPDTGRGRYNHPNTHASADMSLLSPDSHFSGDGSDRIEPSEPPPPNATTNGLTSEPFGSELERWKF